MKRATQVLAKIKWLVLLLVSISGIPVGLTYSQPRQEPGRSIGTITTQGNLIVMELNEGVFGKANMFDLARRTLRFTPDGTGYRAENLTLQWDAESGAETKDPQVTLHNFSFPFSGKIWDSFSIGITGSISFGGTQTTGTGPGPGGGRSGGVSINTGFVVIVEHGNKPSKDLIERANGIRERWIDYWATTTGHRSSMTATVK